MKVALIHDFLIEYGGAERVLEALHEIWPKAPILTAFYNSQTLGPNAAKFKNWKIITSWGTRLPFWRKLVSPYRIFAKSFFESFDLSSFDLVISSSNMYMAKAVKVSNGIHICYCHTPPRFLYGYPTALNWRKNPLLRPLGEIINHIMRVWDFEAAQKVDYFIANSHEVAARIKKFYRRDSTVIYPPVDTSAFSVQRLASRKKKLLDANSLAASPYFLVVSRLVSAKKVDLAVEVCAKLGLPLKVVGTGRELERLKKLASNYSSSEQRESRSSRPALSAGRQARTIGDQESTIEFLDEVSDSQLVTLYQNCRAVIFPAEQEDFGLVPVEAMAAGKSVIALAQGGVLESVIDQKTGVHFNELSVDSLKTAIKKFIELERKNAFNLKFIRHHAQKFSKERFKKEILKFVEKKMVGKKQIRKEITEGTEYDR